MTAAPLCAPAGASSDTCLGASPGASPGARPGAPPGVQPGASPCTCLGVAPHSIPSIPGAQLAPLDRSPLPGAVEERAFALGRALVAEHGVRMDTLLFDADEVLWDWILDLSEMVSRARWRPLQGGWDMSHREWVQPRPGILGLLFGMHGESLARGLDSRLRIWTNGYPYRLWAILRQIPHAGSLLGLADGWEAEEGGEGGECALAKVPTLVFRRDYNDAMAALLDPARREVWLADTCAPIRLALAHHLRGRPLDPNLKLPALAALAGKTGLGQVRILVDDTFGNVVRFTRAGGRAVHVDAPAPALLGGRIPNTVWRRPARRLPALGADLSMDLAAALSRVSGATGAIESADPCLAGSARASAAVQDHAPTWIRIRRSTGHCLPAAGPLGFVIRIPDRFVRTQWIGARERLRALLGGPGTAEALARSIDPEARP